MRIGVGNCIRAILGRNANARLAVGESRGAERLDRAVGELILVTPGEKIPIDGIIAEGETTLDTAALTGESIPRSAGAGDEVFSGCINLSGAVKIRTTKEFGESTVAKIMELVENAGSRKSRSENFISKFARYYTPAVCYGALALALLPPLILFGMGKAPLWGTWIYRALTFLVISCPCALVISIPLSFFSGIGGASAQGILIKGSNFLEALSEAGIVAFDKTGTLTKGVFEVTQLCPTEGFAAAGDSAPLPEASAQTELLRLAALAESYSNHPISKSLREAYNKRVKLFSNEDVRANDTSISGMRTDGEAVSDVRESSGKGVTALVGGVRVACGNAKLMEELHVIGFQPQTSPVVQGVSAAKETAALQKASAMQETAASQGTTAMRETAASQGTTTMRETTASQETAALQGTIVHVAADGVYAGYIVIADSIKENAKKAVAELKENGIGRLVMLTGDREESAAQAAEALGVSEVHAGLLPADKVALVERLIAEKKGKDKVVFVGDGINDAPVLSRADIGIAMGAMGSDAAIEAADVVLMDDDPLKIARAIRISKKCLRIVYENILFAIGIKLLCLVLGALGVANMWAAIFADVGVMVLAVLNAIRALFCK